MEVATTAAYVIAQVEVTDPGAYAVYRSGVLPTIEAAGGRFLVRGGAFELLEGSCPSRTVVIEFPDRRAALGWYHGPAYAALRKLRQAASESVAFYVIDGADG